MVVTARRAVPTALLLLTLAACGRTADRPAAVTPTSGTTATAGALHAVHSVRHVLDDAHLQPGQCHVRQTPGGPLPDPACTPGAIDPAVNQSTIKSTICRPGYTATVRPPATDTDQWKRTAEAAYGVSSGEYDHLVPLELGGANATSNLWVEPGSIPNPKDSVENRLHAEVCAGRITLDAAQQAIAANWTTAP